MFQRRLWTVPNGLGLGLKMKDFVHEGLASAKPRTDQSGDWASARIAFSGQRFITTKSPPIFANLNAQVSSNSIQMTQRQLLALNPPFSPERSGGRIYQRVGKRLLDIALLVLTLPISLPLILLAALALWIEGGQPFYTQDRLGLGGRRFSILKLRTMVRNADQQLESYLARDPQLRKEWNETQKLKHDPRITRVGRILRVTSLDELPQLWNVLKGEMSLVGPRPILPEQLPLYGDDSAYNRLLPGITGLWQVSVRNESSFQVRAKADASYY